MATSFYWYPYDGDYNYLASSSTSWLEAKTHFYLSKNYDNRIYYYLNSSGGWTHGGRKIKITAAQFQVRRNDGGTSTGSMTIYRNGNSGVSCTGTVSAATGTKSLTCSSAFRNDLANYINSGNTYINIKLSGIDNDNSGYIRVCGYNNTAYDSTYRPRFYITWDYEVSTGTIDSNFMYNEATTMTITPNVSTDYHVVEWYINNETTAYYSQTLAAGTTSASCSFFGSSPSGAALDSTNYFTDNETVSAKVILKTYSSAGALLGSKTYTFTLTKPSGGSLIKLDKTLYNYNETITTSVYPIYSSYTQTARYYIKENTLIHTKEFGAISSSTNYQNTIYKSINLSTYFSTLTNTCPAYVILTTYDETGAVTGSNRVDFTLKDPTKTYQSVELSVNPVILTSSIIATSPITQQKNTVENIFNSFKAYLLNKLHPIGSIYVSTSSKNPSTALGGTWVAYSPARTLLSTATASEINTSGGAFTHTLTTNEMGKHRHGLYYTSGVVYTGSSQQEYGAASSGSTIATSAVGGGKAHNNTQPYEICYFWKRTA